jgi:hypothetical protein
MISVFIEKSRNGYAGFTCKGHAGYAEHGNDIVCAAVSMLVINTINSLEKLTDCKFNCDSKMDGYISVTFIDELSESARVLVDSMILGITSVEKQYGKGYVKLTTKEV